jgi:hypothetical protein
VLLPINETPPHLRLKKGLGFPLKDKNSLDELVCQITLPKSNLDSEYSYVKDNRDRVVSYFFLNIVKASTNDFH